MYIFVLHDICLMWSLVQCTRDRTMPAYPASSLHLVDSKIYTSQTLLFLWCQTAAGLFPAAALRGDLGLALTAARFLGPEMLSMAFVAPLLTVSVWRKGATTG